MSLKSYLRALMQTRTTPAEAGHSAMPSNYSINYGHTASYVAGSDGYVMAYANGATRLTVQNQSQELQTLLANSTATVLQGFTLCKKGDMINVSSIGGSVTSKIVRLVGGGVISFVNNCLHTGVRYGFA